MREVSEFVEKKRRPSFLICKKNLIRFYKKYGWVSLNKKKIKIEDHKNLMSGMIYNLNKKEKEKIIKFYYNV